MRNKILLVSLVLGLVVGSIRSICSEPVEGGFGKIKLSGLLQFWYQNDHGAKPFDTFRLRRAEIKLSGEIKPEVLWSIMIDPAQVRDIEDARRFSSLQDFVISLKPHKCCSIDFGQYKVPFGMEGLESSAKLDFVERAAIGPIFKWADYRDIGFTIKGDFNVGKVKIRPSVGLFNGEGQNKLDVNESKDFVGRLVVKPVEQLHIGVAHYNGKTGLPEIDKIHTGGEIKFVKDPISIYGEYATGKSGGKNKTTYYATKAYKFPKSFQIALRYDYYDLNTDEKNDAKTEFSVGINYFIEKHNAKIQLNYILRGEEGKSINNDVFRLNIQIAY